MAVHRSTGARRPRVDDPRTPGSRRLLLLIRGLAAAAAVAFVVGLVAGSGSGDQDRRAAERFAAAQGRGDFGAMYKLISTNSAAAVTPGAFAGAYRSAAATATATAFIPGRTRSAGGGGRVEVPFVVRTRAFGTFRATERIPVKDGRVRWSPDLAFPGLRAGEQLSAHLRNPPRAALLARDGTPLAKGSRRTSPLGPVADAVVGSVERPDAAMRAARRAAGLPTDVRVGTTGLERVFERRLAGTPGGELRAGSRMLTRSTPRPGAPVRTSISPKLERAAIAALGGRFGGAAALDPRTGEVLALAGVAFSVVQPPGSTFKIITTTAALEAHLTSPKTSYPVRTGAQLEGRTLSNANGESCGGTLVHSFAESCNSVFAPLGARVGAKALVAAAERFGFNRDPGIEGAATSTIPPASQLTGALETGSSAIGQGRVQATVLQMGTVAATIAERGRRPRPTLLFRPTPALDRVTNPKVARTIGRLMRAVVNSGTGTSAQIPGVAVAGKTGTAELGAPAGPDGAASGGTDAWFVAYAPAARPTVAVSVLLVKAGAGGQVAAPVARQILQAGVRR